MTDLTDLTNTIRAMTPGTRRGLAEWACALRNQAVEAKQHTIASYWNATMCLVLDVEDEVKRGWSDILASYDLPAAPPTTPGGQN